MNASFPKERDVLRPFVLEDGRGRRINLEDLRQRKNLVLLFMQDSTAATETLLTHLRERNDALNTEEAVVLPVLHGSVEDAQALQKRLHLPFAVLADPDGRIVRQFSMDGSSIYVTDRFREVFAVRHGNLLSPDEILEWLAHINRQCPE